MARISWSDGMDLARREAWRQKGKENATLLVYGRFIPWVLGAVALGVLGYYAKKAWDHTLGALSSSTDTPAATATHSGVPSWVWLAGIVLSIATVVVLRGRPGYARRLSTIALIVVACVLVWLGFIAFVIGSI